MWRTVKTAIRCSDEGQVQRNRLRCWNWSCVLRPRLAQRRFPKRAPTRREYRRNKSNNLIAWVTHNLFIVRAPAFHRRDCGGCAQCKSIRRGRTGGGPALGPCLYYICNPGRDWTGLQPQVNAQLAECGPRRKLSGARSHLSGALAPDSPLA
jgi:hypothetical protein